MLSKLQLDELMTCSRFLCTNGHIEGRAAMDFSSRCHRRMPSIPPVRGRIERVILSADIEPNLAVVCAIQRPSPDPIILLITPSSLRRERNGDDSAA